MLGACPDQLNARFFTLLAIKKPSSAKFVNACTCMPNSGTTVYTVYVIMWESYLKMILFVPPNFALILRHTFVRVEGSVFFRVLATTHWVRTPI